MALAHKVVDAVKYRINLMPPKLSQADICRVQIDLKDANEDFAVTMQKDKLQGK